MSGAETAARKSFRRMHRMSTGELYIIGLLVVFVMLLAAYYYYYDYDKKKSAPSTSASTSSSTSSASTAQALASALSSMSASSSAPAAAVPPHLAAAVPPHVAAMIAAAAPPAPAVSAPPRPAAAPSAPSAPLTPAQIDALRNYKRITDCGYGTYHRGWYDMLGNGERLDYCRLVGNPGDEWASCALRNSTKQHTPNPKVGGPLYDLTQPHDKPGFPRGTPCYGSG